MSSSFVNFGIDLGTTNSAIAETVRGRPMILKSRLPPHQDTIPSCVAFQDSDPEARPRVGITALNLLRNHLLKGVRNPDVGREIPAYREIKRLMGGKHVYHPFTGGASFTAADLSAAILRELRDHVDNTPPTSVVVTVPARFKERKRRDTLLAGEIAGFTQTHLLQEPVAAAMAYGLLQSRAHNEKWLVFDFGGGTFDVALVLVDDGQIVVKDTAGHEYLGGKNLAGEITKNIILPRFQEEHDFSSFASHHDLLRHLFSFYAEETLANLSQYDEHDFEVFLPLGPEIILEKSFSISRDAILPYVTPLFQRAIDITNELLMNHGLRGTDVDNLVLVGGPTQSPILRQMLAEQIRAPDTSLDPMVAVALGAAFFASTVEKSEDSTTAPVSVMADTTKGSIALDVVHETTSVNDREWVSVQIASTPESLRDVNLTIAITRDGWKSDRIPLTNVDGALLAVDLAPDAPNVFTFEVCARGDALIDTTPSEFTIVQGVRLTGAPMPYTLGVTVLVDAEKTNPKTVFRPLRGAEKAKPLPATGTIRGLSTTHVLRPGMPSDKLLLEFLEGDSHADGVRSIFLEHTRDWKVTGVSVDRVIPKGTSFDLTVVTDSTSGTPETVTVYFPSFDFSCSGELARTDRRPVHADWIAREIADARALIRRSRVSGHIRKEVLAQHEQALNAVEGDISQSLHDTEEFEEREAAAKEALRGLYDLLDSNEWNDIENQLRHAWNDLRSANAEEGHDDSRLEMQEARNRLQRAMEIKDAKFARLVISEFHREKRVLKICDNAKTFIEYTYRRFNSISWSDANTAKIHVDNGHEAIANGDSCSDIIGHFRNILKFYPRDSVGYKGPPIPEL